MKRSPSAVALGVLAGVLVAVLSGCSLFQRSTAGQSDAVPAVSSQPVTTTPAGSGSATPAASSPAQTAASSSARAAAPTPPVVPGYTLAARQVQIERRFQTVTGQFRGVFSGVTSRTVVKGGKDQVGSLVLLGLNPELVGNTQVEQRLVPGMIEEMSGQGADVTTQTVSGQKVAVATTKSTNVVAWYRSGTVVLVLGNGAEPAQSLDFTKAYLSVR